jgi:hypothetical protein
MDVSQDYQKGILQALGVSQSPLQSWLRGKEKN